MQKSKVVCLPIEIYGECRGRYGKSHYVSSDRDFPSDFCLLCCTFIDPAPSPALLESYQLRFRRESILLGIVLTVLTSIVLIGVFSHQSWLLLIGAAGIYLPVPRKVWDYLIKGNDQP